MAPEPYRGPISLAASKYASPQRQAQFAAFPSAVSSLSPTAKGVSNGTLATKEQIADSYDKISTEVASYNADAQLAMAQNESLKEEVYQHSAVFAKSLSSAVSNTRQLLTLVRDSIKKESAAAASQLATVDNIWKELEQLFEAAEEAKNALPKFLDKQKDNMSLYHNSVVNETMRESQAELDFQYNKVNIQHSLILEHQQLFQDYKAKTDARLNNIKELEELVSRFTLEKGLYRKELEEVNERLEQANATNASDRKKADDLQKEIGIREKIKSQQQEMSDRYEKELRQKTEQIGKEQQKAVQLQGVITALKSGDQKELDQLRTSTKALNDKFKNQGIEHAKAIADLQYKDKKIAALTEDIERLQKQIVDLEERTAKLDSIEKAYAEATNAKKYLQEEVNKLQHELGDLNGQVPDLRKQAEALSQKLKTTQKENDELETEKNDLLAKASELKKVSSWLTILRSENAKLLATVQELQSKPTKVDSTGLGVVLQEKNALNDEVKGLEDELAQAKQSVEDWTVLAKRSYDEYKYMLPLYKDAEKHRQACLDKEKEIAALQVELKEGKAQSNGVGDGAYWKDRYETLLATVG